MDRIYWWLFGPSLRAALNHAADQFAAHPDAVLTGREVADLLRDQAAEVSRREASD